MAHTTSHMAAHGLLRHAVARGIPEHTVAGWLGVPAADLERPGRLPAGQVVRAWVRLRDELADPSVAVRATSAWSLADYRLFGFCVATAPTLRAAFRVAVQAVRLVTQRGSWRPVE